MDSDRVELCAEPLDVAAALRDAAVPAAGGIAVFLGTTREETDPQGRALLALEYEAYPTMALRQMRDLVAAARQRWPLCRVIVLHRTGLVPLAEASVLIAVSAAHRGEAFEASRWIIDQLKAEVAVWKKEVWDDASSSWVHPAKG